MMQAFQSELGVNVVASISKDEFAKAQKGKRHFKDDSI